MPEVLIVNDIPPERLQDTIELHRRENWRVRAINVEPDGEYTVVFER